MEIKDGNTQRKNDVTEENQLEEEYRKHEMSVRNQKK